MIQKVHMVTSGVRLIGIHGRAGSGKDTIAAHLHSNYQSVWTQHFASPLKVAVAAAFGLPLSDFQDRDLKEKTNEFWNISPRKMAQYFGTEMFRDHIVGLLPDCRSDFWIRHLTGVLNGDLVNDPEDGYSEYDSSDTVVVPDVRFSNEADWILENGGTLIHVYRLGSGGQVGISGHSSEADIDRTSMTDMSNNSTKESLYETVDIYARYIGLERKPHDPNRLTAADF